MKPARIIVIVIAAVAAIGLAFVVRMMGSGQPASQAAAAPVVQQEPTTKVLVAARELKPGQRLTEEDMTWKDWPLDALTLGEAELLRAVCATVHCPLPPLVSPGDSN